MRDSEISAPLAPVPCACERPIGTGDETCLRCGRALQAPTPARPAPTSVFASWTPGQRAVIDAIQRWARERGHPPTMTQWGKRQGSYPGRSTVLRHFASWKAAIVAAGFTPPAQGRKPKHGRAR